MADSLLRCKVLSEILMALQYRNCPRQKYVTLFPKNHYPRYRLLYVLEPYMLSSNSSLLIPPLSLFAISFLFSFLFWLSFSFPMLMLVRANHKTLHGSHRGGRVPFGPGIIYIRNRLSITQACLLLSSIIIIIILIMLFVLLLISREYDV